MELLMQPAEFTLPEVTPVLGTDYTIAPMLQVQVFVILPIPADGFTYALRYQLHNQPVELDGIPIL
jgi:hypothetical protein